MSKNKLILPVFSILLLACSLLNLAGEYGNVKTVSPSDEEMNAAIQKARDTLPLFVEELKNPKPTQTSFSIKAKFPFNDNGGAEHLWIGGVTYDNDQFTGVLENEPYYVNGYHIGDTIVTEFENVTDWMIIDNNQLIGGFTIHILINHLSEDEIAQFESESGFRISEEPLLP